MAVLVTLVNIKKTAMNRGFHKVVLSTTISSCDLLERQWNTAATACFPSFWFIWLPAGRSRLKKTG